VSLPWEPERGITMFCVKEMTYVAVLCNCSHNDKVRQAVSEAMRERNRSRNGKERAHKEITGKFHDSFRFIV
jgi:hypothetical protein